MVKTEGTFGWNADPSRCRTNQEVSDPPPLDLNSFQGRLLIVSWHWFTPLPLDIKAQRGTAMGLAPLGPRVLCLGAVTFVGSLEVPPLLVKEVASSLLSNTGEHGHATTTRS